MFQYCLAPHPVTHTSPDMGARLRFKQRKQPLNKRIFKLFHQPNLMHNFLCSLTTCLLHYYPQHVSSINMPIFRRKNCIHTTSGIFALCKRLHSTLVESGPVYCAEVYRERRHLMLCEYIFPPEDGHVNARNMSRIIV